MQVRDLRSQHLRTDQWSSIVWAQDQGNLQTLPQGRALTSPVEAPLQLRTVGLLLGHREFYLNLQVTWVLITTSLKRAKMSNPNLPGQKSGTDYTIR